MWSAGFNKFYQLGDHSCADNPKFLLVFMVRATVVSAGTAHTMIITQDGDVWGTGQNLYGQLGAGQSKTGDSRADKEHFQKIQAGVSAMDVSAGGYHTLLMKHGGTVWAAGRNNHGQLGDRTTSDRLGFVYVLPAGVRAIAAGGYHSLVVMRDSTVWSTGSNSFGQLGARFM